jgi:Na+-transporting NADH:ubiquinone oxidoreductase subunit C
MAINKNSNAYTFFFAITMVVVVGVALALISQSLKPMQQQNEATKKKMDILGAIKVEANRENASELFDQYVARRVAVDYLGKEVSAMNGEIDPFDKNDPFNIDVQKDYRGYVKKIVKELGKNPEALSAALKEAPVTYPVFECEKDGRTLYVCPMVGTGLWGPIWGYVALEGDYTTIYGAKFDHKTETPGLGAEINTPLFQDKFEGQKLNIGNNTLFSVLKGGSPTDQHSVDGITGGTITSKGVDEMLNRTLPVYVRFLQSANQQRAER